MLAWYGGIAVDLREAVLAPDARLRVHTLFGGIAIRVPPEWRIESSANALVGGVEVRGAQDDPSAPTLALEGWALFGGIAVGAKAGDAPSES
jgi:predicted membrane protein